MPPRKPFKFSPPNLAEIEAEAERQARDAAQIAAVALNPELRLPRSARPSKTQMKKESHDLQELGEALLELPKAKLDALDLPEGLRDALDDLARTRSFEGKRRQWQYVGKLMRGIDPAPLREAVAAMRIPSARETLALHEAEAWRDRLIGSDDAMTAWMAEHPATDAQALRSLIRSARKDAQAAAAAQAHDGAPERKGRAYREIFQLVREALAGAEGAARDDDDGLRSTHDD
ncbi:ribosome biogenesis factor YjgA [Leptothrix discophora]|uniref:Dual-action ribosomal maturation protein DarP n=1 Tax=Leptothrix discophora TaxID=89 RepID=A0ABT9G876_LEPDI|nr:ribosome biogenesis factor YjgA [Leptothrix discophora]MDP4302621.1 ribosome biogenesis factor YjgA [Leptothrix discophora]